MTPSFRFLTVEDVLTLHAIAIEDQGGDATIRDRGLLESAVATPAQSVGGELLHEDVPAIAAAYAFHICSNHPFVDGNKRTGLASALIFLSLNGIELEVRTKSLVEMVESVARGDLSKSGIAEFFRRHEVT